MLKTYSAKTDEVQKEWYIVDADGQTVGRLAVQIANVLRGKHKPTYTPHIDSGDNVIIINAEKVVVSGKKYEEKLYRHHTGYIGGIKTFTFRQMMERKPERIMEIAVRGMLPHNRLGRQQIKKLHVYVGAEHPHEAQQPKAFPQ
ncbi:MAG: 50S ribosomal protein L13 [Vampirovibrionales bacterium]|jgi:large subunit ribosomal protein L13|nr:50S ribosomal protein L13 [Vampirovibrionales bacterium]